jgi:hypothetical protein
LAPRVNNHHDYTDGRAANWEHLAIFAKLQPFINETREMIGETDYLYQLERLVSKVENVEKKLENRRRLLEGWVNAKSVVAQSTGTT